MMVTGREFARVTTLFVLSLSACSSISNLGAKSWPLSASVPAASGEVMTRKWDGRNRTVEVRVKNLAPPDQIAPGAMTYVVWFLPTEPNAPPQNMGALMLDPDLSGTLVAQTTFVNFNVIVTAESAANVPQPTGKQVLQTEVRGPSPTS